MKGPRSVMFAILGALIILVGTAVVIKGMVEMFFTDAPL